MSLALQEAKLLEHIMRSAKRSQELKETIDNDEDKKECIYQEWKKIRDFDLDVQKRAKISRMYTNTVQKEFFAVQTSTE